jgi:hypothetical protein
MLRVPKIITELAPPGVLRTDADRAWRMFQDPTQSGVVVVTLAEEMPTNETFELVGSLRDELSLPISGLLVNSLLPQLWSTRERDTLRVLPEPAASGGPGFVLGAAIRRACDEQAQIESLARLTTLGLPMLTLPRLIGGASDFEAIEQLVKAFSP